MELGAQFLTLVSQNVEVLRVLEQFGFQPVDFLVVEIDFVPLSLQLLLQLENEIVVIGHQVLDDLSLFGSFHVQILRLIHEFFIDTLQHLNLLFEVLVFPLRDSILIGLVEEVLIVQQELLVVAI